MDGKNWRQSIKAYDNRRDLIVPGDHETTLQILHRPFYHHRAGSRIEDHG